jgi:hypothetical protein
MKKIHPSDMEMTELINPEKEPPANMAPIAM